MFTGKVECHPSSVNSEFGASFPFPWLVYCEKVKTSGVYIRDSTCVPAYAVLLLGGDLDEDSDDGGFSGAAGDTAGGDSGVIRVCGGHYTFSAPRDVLALVRKLRREIDSLLDAKARNPGLDFTVGCDSSGATVGSGFVDAMRALVADEERAAYGGDRGGDRGGGDDRGGDRGGRGGFGGGDWECSNGCGLVFGGKRSCFRCGAPREGDRGDGGRGGLGGGPPAPRHVRF